MTINQLSSDFHKEKLLEEPIFFQHKKQIETLTTILNKKNMVILSGMKHVGKTPFIKEFLTKSWKFDQCFYYNNNLNSDNNIKSWKDLINQLNESLNKDNNIKIIVLQNFNKIDNIKKFIQYIHSHDNKFKIILFWNTIKIKWVQEVELLPESLLDRINNNSLENIVSFWLLPEILLIQHEHFKKKFLNLMVNDIFTKEVFFNFWVKSIDLYKLTMTFLSKNNSHISLRELQKWLSSMKQITLKTTIDYIDFSIRAKIIKPVYRYDFKKHKTISSRVKYYFTDTGIRNSISQYNLPEYSLKENLLFQELSQNWYQINSGINGTFEFTFVAEKNNEKLFFHYSKQVEKTELKKEINKLNKVPWNWKRYLIIENFEDFQIKKVKYDNVEIVKYKDVFEKLR